MDWTKEFPASILMCDNNGFVTDMNEKAAATFADDGGYALVGENLFECHTAASNEKIKESLNKYMFKSWNLDIQNTYSGYAFLPKDQVNAKAIIIKNLNFDKTEIFNLKTPIVDKVF